MNAWYNEDVEFSRSSRSAGAILRTSMARERLVEQGIPKIRSKGV
jgi:hypothetical protein